MHPVADGVEGDLLSTQARVFVFLCALGALGVLGALALGCQSSNGNGDPVFDAGAPVDDGGPTPEQCATLTDEELCSSVGAQCGTVECGDERSVECGVCDFPEVCGAVKEHQCDVPAAWFGIGGSDFGPWSELTTWGSASGGGVSGGNGSIKDVALAPDGKVYVLYYRAGFERLRMFDGTGWQEIIGPDAADGAFDGKLYDVDVDSMGRVLVVGVPLGSGTEQSDQLTLRRFDGTAWVDLAGFGEINESGQCSSASIVVDAADHVWVAWRHKDAAGTWRVYLKRYDGSSFTAVEGSASGPGPLPENGTLYAVAVDSTGRPSIAWRAEQFSGPIRLTTLDGAAWTTADAGVPGSEDIYWEMPSLGFDAADRPVVATRDSQAGVLRAHRFDGAAWQLLSEGLGSAEFVGESGLAAGAGQELIYTWTGTQRCNIYHPCPVGECVNEVCPQEAHVQRLVGDTWVEVGASGRGINGVLQMESPIFAAVQGDSVVAAWEAKMATDTMVLGHSAVHLKHFDGADWLELGAGNVAGEGLSGSDQHSRDVALAAGTDEKITAAWIDGGFVHVRRFESEAWREVGAGSASGEGLFVAAEEYLRSVEEVAVAVDGTAPVVAWQAYNSLFVNRFDGTTWVPLEREDYSQGSIATGAKDLSILAPGDGTLFVIYAEVKNPYNLHMLSYEAGVWSDIGQLAGAMRAEKVDAVLGTDGLPIVTWADYLSLHDKALHVARYDGNKWNELDFSGLNATDVDDAALTLDSEGNPLVIWRTWEAATHVVHTKVFKDGIWSDAGCGTVFKLDVRGQQPIGRLAAARGPHGHPFVAWGVSSHPFPQLFARRLEPGGWEGVFGSAADGGISNSAAASWQPALVSTGALMCAAWQELGRAASDIVLRCAVPEAPDLSVPAPTCDDPVEEHPLYDTFTGTPVDCTTRAPSGPQQNVKMTMTFTSDEMSVNGSYPSGTGTCSTRGSGDLVGLSEVSFTLQNYQTSSTSCNWGMFLAQSAYAVTYEFTDSSEDTLFLAPEGYECYLLNRQ